MEELEYEKQLKTMGRNMARLVFKKTSKMHFIFLSILIKM